MKNYYYLLMLVFTAGAAVAAEKAITVTVINPAVVERKSEIIELDWAAIHCALPAAVPEFISIREKKSKKELIVQPFDGNGDGVTDQILVQSDFAPKEKKEFLVTSSVAKKEKPVSFVDGRFIEPRQDYAWENDRIAFRVYGPALAAEVNNGIDVWTKRVRYLIVEKWYKESAARPQGSSDTYHQDRGEGADFFSVGRTLGCGGAGIWSNGKVYQPGVFSYYRTLANGPLRICFELTYSAYNVEGKKIQEVKRISLDAGKNLNKVELLFTSLIPDEPLEVVSGLVKRKNTNFTSSPKECWISLWGLTNDDAVNGYLGTGVVFDPSSYLASEQDSLQYTIRGKIRTGHPFTYYAGAGWSRTGDFTNAESWSRYLQKFSLLIQSPLVIVYRR